MEITHLGHSSFKVRGKRATLVTDPFDPEFISLKFPKVEASVVTVSHEHGDHNFTKGVGGEPTIIDGPGEYEVAGIKIMGLSSFHDDKRGEERGKNTVYYIEMDKVSLAHLGDLGDKLDDAVSEILNGVDVLMIPVGGFYTISPVTAVEIITKLEPSIIIPMHYRPVGTRNETLAKLEPVSTFLKEMGKENVTPEPKLSISKDKIPGEATVVVLE